MWLRSPGLYEPGQGFLGGLVEALDMWLTEVIIEGSQHIEPDFDEVNGVF